MSNDDSILNVILKQQEHILNAVTVIKEDITDIKVIQTRHDENLQEHMRRSLANEEAVSILKEEFKPVQQHVLNIDFLVKIAGYASGAVLFIYTAIQIIQSIHH